MQLIGVAFVYQDKQNLIGYETRGTSLAWLRWTGVDLRLCLSCAAEGLPEMKLLIQSAVATMVVLAIAVGLFGAAGGGLGRAEQRTGEPEG